MKLGGCQSQHVMSWSVEVITTLKYSDNSVMLFSMHIWHHQGLHVCWSALQPHSCTDQLHESSPLAVKWGSLIMQCYLPWDMLVLQLHWWCVSTFNLQRILLVLNHCNLQWHAVFCTINLCRYVHLHIAGPTTTCTLWVVVFGAQCVWCMVVGGMFYRMWWWPKECNL